VAEVAVAVLEVDEPESRLMGELAARTKSSTRPVEIVVAEQANASGEPAVEHGMRVADERLRPVLHVRAAPSGPECVSWSPT
jgi:hypothetical protein